MRLARTTRIHAAVAALHRGWFATVEGAAAAVGVTPAEVWLAMRGRA